MQMYALYYQHSCTFNQSVIQNNDLFLINLTHFFNNFNIWEVRLTRNNYISLTSINYYFSSPKNGKS